MRTIEIALPRRAYASRNGLSERLVRARFLRAGFEVFRGAGFLGPRFVGYYDEYENVRKKYDHLESILEKRFGNMLTVLRAIIRSPKGMPDYLVVKGDALQFVEVKLEHEAIAKHQLAKMARLEEFGLAVIVLRVKSAPYRLEGEISADGTRRVLVRQKRFATARKRSSGHADGT